MNISEYGNAIAHPDLAYHAAIASAHQHFPHLEWQQILNPPKNMLDAALARQFALYVVAMRFGVPKKRVCKIAEISREVFWRFIPKFEERMVSGAFRDHLDAIELLAREMIERRVAEL